MNVKQFSVILVILILMIDFHFAQNSPADSLRDSVKNSIQDSLQNFIQDSSMVLLPDNMPDSLTIVTKPQPPTLDITAFDVGEKLTFKIRYGFIKAGNAEMKVLRKTSVRGKEVYHIQTTASSVSFFDAFYKVRDEVNSFVTTDGFYTLRFEKKLREGDYYFDLFVDYMKEDSLANVETIRYEDSDLNIRERKKFDVKVPPYINDILSSFYYIRNKDLQVGKSIFISNHEKDKVYDLEIRVYKKEDIEVEAGEFRCIVVEPLLKGEGLFKQEGKMTIWLTDDELKIPVQMKTKIAIGSLTTELTKIEGVKKPIRAKISD